MRFTRGIILPLYRNTEGIRDAPADDLDDLLDPAFEQLIADLERDFEDALNEWLGRLDNWHAEHYASAVEDEIDFNIRDIVPEGEFGDEIATSVRENVALVTGLTGEARKDLERIIYTSVQENRGAREVAREISERLGINRRRALFIARDQRSKITGTLDKLRQTSLGITHYIWRDSDDDRVRPTHAEVDGKLFRWDTEVPNGLVRPGFEINCRCQAQAHIVLEGDNQ